MRRNGAKKRPQEDVWPAHFGRNLRHLFIIFGSSSSVLLVAIQKTNLSEMQYFLTYAYMPR